MNSRHSPEWLTTTVSAVRELMMKRLEAQSLDQDAKREIEIALEELDVMWEELQGQAALLVRENERYAEFFQYAPDAYLITDIGGVVREANEAALELLKAARDNVLAHPLSEFIADEDRVNFLARTVSLMLGASARSLLWEARLKPRAGEACAARFSVRAIPLKKSGVGGLCWLIRPAP
jgi:two-component system, OmpR family, sensor histidine kinase VicK